MFATLHLWWAEDPRVPNFINIFGDAQKKATRASLPITDDWLAAMATSALLSENSLPNNRLSLDGLVPSSLTWTAWKLNFFPLHIAMERELWASSQSGDSFQSANLVMASHIITATLPTLPTTGQGPSSKYYMSHFNAHFDNLAAAATNSGAALDQLAAITTTQYSEIKALLNTLKTASNRASRPSSYAAAAAAATDSTPSIPLTEAKRRIIQIESAVCNNWHCGAFCSTHGWGVNKNHTSEN